MSNTSSITRAFSKRPKRPQVSAPMPHREGHAVYSPGTIKRGKISAPVELLSTTNQLVYSAPDIHPPTSSSSSSSSSLRSSNGSDPSHTPHTMHSPITSPEISSVEASPVVAEPNHLSSYFKTPQRSGTVGSTSTTASTTPESPAIPQRSLSHTKKSHHDLARKNSRSRMTPPPSTLSKPNSLRTSHEFFKTNADPSHPFGKELEQVNEVAEDFGARMVLDEEEELLMKKGLKKFSVEDYRMEIEDLYGGVFEDQLGPLSGAWI